MRDQNGVAKSSIAPGGNRFNIGSSAAAQPDVGTGAFLTLGTAPGEGDRARIEMNTGGFKWGAQLYLDGNVYIDNDSPGTFTFWRGAGNNVRCRFGDAISVFSVATSPSSIPGVDQGAPGQAASLREFRDASGAVKASVSPAGDVEITDASAGLILKSQDGAQRKVRATDANGLTVNGVAVGGGSGGNIDGGTATSVYGGSIIIDGGGA